MIFKKKKVNLSLEEKWAKATFDNCDYYALTAPINQCGTTYPMHCLSEAAGPIVKEV